MCIKGKDLAAVKLTTEGESDENIVNPEVLEGDEHKGNVSGIPYGIITPQWGLSTGFGASNLTPQFYLKNSLIFAMITLL